MSDKSYKIILPYVYFGVKFVGGLIAFGLIALYRYQNNILYIPNPPGIPKTVKENPKYFTSPSHWTIHGRPKKDSSTESSIPYEELHLTTSDGVKLHCWLLLQPNYNSKIPTLIYFHGNAGNMGFRLKNAAEMYGRLGINVLMMDYRGYGSSTGIPDENGLNIDAETVLKYVTHSKKLHNGPVILFGRSLGGAVAISLAHKFPDLVQGIIVENTFLSISAMVDRIFSFLRSLKYFILRIKWDSDHKIKTLSHPILFISGDSDELVPPFHMKQLYDLATMSIYRDFYSVSGGTHNDTWDVAGKAYYERIRDFLEHAGKEKKDSLGIVTEEIDSVDHDLKASIPTMTTSFTVK